MRLSKTDKKILELLNKEKAGLTCPQMCNKLKIKQPQLFLRLRKMTVYNILEKISSNPTIYRINLKEKHQMIFYHVECPKCKEIRRIHYKHSTATCRNPDCKTKKGAKTRFWIYDNRIIKTERII